MPSIAVETSGVGPMVGLTAFDWIVGSGQVQAEAADATKGSGGTEE